MLLNAIRLISGAAARRQSRVVGRGRRMGARGVHGRAADRGGRHRRRGRGRAGGTASCSWHAACRRPGRSRATANGRSVPRSVLGRITDELVTVHGQADQLRIASAARQREFLDAVAGDQAELASYRQAWEALAAMDERLEKLASQEVPRSGSRPTTYANRSSASIGSIRSRGRTRTSRFRRSRIENAAEIAQGVGGALGRVGRLGGRRRSGRIWGPRI